MTSRKVVQKDLIAWPVCILVLIFSPFTVFAGEILIDDYVDGLSPRWVEKSFKGKTQYEVTQEDNHLCIKATSSASASALYYKIKYDTNDFPVPFGASSVILTLGSIRGIILLRSKSFCDNR